MDTTVSNLQKLSFDGGLGKTKTWVATVGQTVTPSSSLVVDTTAGYSLLDQWGYGPDYGTNFGLQLGVPGSNGPDIRQSGMPVWGNGMTAQGSTDSWNPYTRYDPTYTAAANVTKLAGTHSVRFGAAIDHQSMNHWQPEFGGTGPRGRVDFSGNLSGLRSGPQSPNFYNQYASFLLGLTSQVQKAIQWEDMSTREMRYGFYFGAVWIHIRVPATPADARESLVDGDSSEPGRELRSAVELTQMAVRIDVRLLHDILGLTLDPENGPCCPVDPLVVTSHQHLEQGRLPREYATHHLFIRQQAPSFKN